VFSEGNKLLTFSSELLNKYSVARKGREGGKMSPERDKDDQTYGTEGNLSRPQLFSL